MRTSTNAVRPLARAVDGVSVGTRTQTRINFTKKFPAEAKRRQRPRGRAGMSAAVLCGPVFVILHPLTVLHRRSQGGLRLVDDRALSLSPAVACSVLT
jgi:hypothetical protein